MTHLHIAFGLSPAASQETFFNARLSNQALEQQNMQRTSAQKFAYPPSAPLSLRLRPSVFDLYQFTFFAHSDTKGPSVCCRSAVLVVVVAAAVISSRLFCARLLSSLFCIDLASFLISNSVSSCFLLLTLALQRESRRRTQLKALGVCLNARCGAMLNGS